MESKNKNKVPRYVLIIGLVLAFFVSFSHGWTGFWIALITIFIYAGLKQSRNKEKKLELRQSLIVEAQKAIDKIKSDKALPTVSSSLMLGKDEQAFLEEASYLAEPRAVRKSGGSGVGLRVMKGVYVGGYKGQSESHQEWRLIDQGTLTLTNNKIVFRGTKENKTIPLDKIISIKNSLEAIEISITDKTKPVSFKVQNSYIWAGTVHIMKAAKDPLHLGEMKIEIELV